MKGIIQATLWDNFGGPELSLALEVAETECGRLSAIQPGASLETYGFMLDHLEGLVKAAKETNSHWNRWAPAMEQMDLTRRMRELEICLPRLVSGKAALIQAKVERDRQPVATTGATQGQSVLAIKLRPTALPRFDGSRRSFYRWRKDWEALQSQGEPTGSVEVKKFQLLDSLEDKVVRDLRLSTYGTADEIFRVLENRFGKKVTIALEIIEELQALPAVRGHQPRKVVDLIRVIEKALHDLEDLGDAAAMKNPLVTKSLESKLPEGLKKDWLVYAAAGKKETEPKDRFEKLLAFLRSQEQIYEPLEQLRNEDPRDSCKKEPRIPPKQARTKATNSMSHEASCVVCG